MKSSIQPLERGDNTTDVVAKVLKVNEKMQAAGRLVHICAWCGKIKNKEGFWIQPEAVCSQSHDVKLTHGTCPKCREREASLLEGRQIKDRKLSHANQRVV
jgi:hypothetical protein